MKLVRTRVKYSRKLVNEDKEKIYVFSDNCDRSSGNNKISDDSSYSKRFGLTGLCHPTMTSAIIRGCERAFPITTMKRYSKDKGGTKWTDDDFKEFKKVIDDDINHIKKAIDELKPKAVVFPTKGILNTKMSDITVQRTPKLFSYILDKEMELYQYDAK